MKRALKGIFVWAILQALAVSVSACPECRAKVRDGIYGQDFSANLFVLLLPVVVLIAVGVGLYFADEVAERARELMGRWKSKGHAAR